MIMGRPRKAIPKRLQTYIVFDDFDLSFEWDRKEVREVDRLWAEGVSLMEIAKRFKRPHVEVLLLLIDRDMKGKIQPRKGVIWGKEYRRWGA